MPDIPESLGRYRIEMEIGKGGMGRVYRARDERLGRVVALKVLSDAQLAGKDARNRFRHEARAAAVLNHPSIATVYDYDEVGGVPLIAYEFVEGETLDRLLERERPSEARILSIGSRLASALAYAHERGILHRDVKPQNIMVTPDGGVKILDFGLAKRTGIELVGADGQASDSTTVATAAGTIVGTVQYMSPEQIAGDVLDGRTDIFSLGIVLYEMASGTNPFAGASFGSTVGKVLTHDPPSLGGDLRVSPALDAIIARAIRKNRAERFASARELEAELERLREVVSAAPVSARQLEVRGPVIPRGAARVSLVLLQVLYLSMYGFALVYNMDVLRAVAQALAATYLRLPAIPVASALLVTGCAGIAIRFYLMASVGFDHPDTGRQFRRLFPLLLLLDEIWALSPLLLVGKWPDGITLLAMAALAYLPFSHRNLVAAAYETA